MKACLALALLSLSTTSLATDTVPVRFTEGCRGKQPPDTHVWILTGDAPAFVKSEGPLFAGGPSWRIELAVPTWPAASTTSRDR